MAQKPEKRCIGRLRRRYLQENAVDNRMQLYSHIVLSGGCTMIPGLPARLEKDLRRMYLDQILQVCMQTRPIWCYAEASLSLAAQCDSSMVDCRIFDIPAINGDKTNKFNFCFAGQEGGHEDPEAQS